MAKTNKKKRNTLREKRLLKQFRKQVSKVSRASNIQANLLKLSSLKKAESFKISHTGHKRNKEQLKDQECLILADRFLEQSIRLEHLGGWEFNLQKQAIVPCPKMFFSQKVSLQKNIVQHFKLNRFSYTLESMDVLRKAFFFSVKQGLPFDIEIELMDNTNKEQLFLRAIGYAVTERGKVKKIIGVFLDITEKEKVLAEIEEARNQLFNILNFLPDATFVIDKNGRVTAWNKAIEKMTGIKAAQIIGKGNYEYALPFYGERRPILIDLVLKNTPQVREKYINIKENNGILYAETFVPCVYNNKGAYLSGVASPLYDSKGNLIGAIESIRDLTELKKTQEELLHASKLAFMGQIAASISHELNQPLTGIKGFAQAAYYDLQPDNPLRKDLDKIIEQADRMKEIIGSICQFSRKTTQERKTIDLEKVIFKSIDLMSVEFNNLSIKTQTYFESVLPKLFGDENQLQQVFLNLLANAKDALESNPPEKERKITVKAIYDKPKKSLVVSITDTGMGILPEYLKQIGTPFFTTKQPGRGLGLGISVVKRILSQFNASIDFQSTPQIGTTVTLTFSIN
ncbi:MAG: ATP-binding protein [Candidatus Omnitrophica bacterium]|nr:ATP-binding protein [Candidatus Omnitrophota bacterium]